MRKRSLKLDHIKKYDPKLYKLHEYLGKHRYTFVVSVNVLEGYSLHKEEKIVRCDCGKCIWVDVYNQPQELLNDWKNEFIRRAWGRKFNTMASKEALDIHFKLKEGLL